MILLVGTNKHNLDLLDQLLTRQGYQSLQIPGLDALDAALDSPDAFDLALVDVTGFDASIWTRCQRLHDSGIRLLVISPRQSADLRQRGLAHGAHDILVKPLVMRELTELIRSLLAL